MTVDVLVVGAGPSGLFSAIELARHGVRARVVEREPEPHRQARATSIQPGTLELLARAGLANGILAASEHIRFVRLMDANLDVISETDFAGTGCRWEFQCSLPQWRTEQVLSDRLNDLGVTVHRGVAASSIESRGDGLLVGLEYADGRTEQVEAGWVIGAGGAHSLTRASLVQELTGSTYPGTALVADVRIGEGPPRDGAAIVATAQGYVLLAPLPEDRWLTFIGDLADAEVEGLREAMSHGTVAASMQQRLGTRVALEEVAWASLFRMHRRIAPRLAGERRFLLGDAGHLSSPFGGEGMNSGLHDACNLGWKLALAVHGHAAPGLIESFEVERLSADRHVLEVSDQLHALAHGAVESARSGISTPPPPPDETAAMLRSRCMLDVSYAQSALVGEYVADGARPPAHPATGTRYPDGDTLTGTKHHVLLYGDADESGAARLRDRWTGLVDVTRVDDHAPSSALLIRPDGYVGYRATPADAAGLRALEAHLSGYMVP
ncbi:MAG TPA: FAD-dependent monooxygenase [Solirubrobacteraceae bacterium]|nr:FAD-dependent monooxygenase [Solirubrobacteraceae bacterium]